MQLRLQSAVELAETLQSESVMKNKFILMSASAMVIFGALGAQPAESRILHSFTGAAIGTPGAANKASPIRPFIGAAA